MTIRPTATDPRWLVLSAMVLGLAVTSLSSHEFPDVTHRVARPQVIAAVRLEAVLGIYEREADPGALAGIQLSPSLNHPAAPAALAAPAYGTGASCLRTKNTPAFPPVTGMTPLSKYG